MLDFFNSFTQIKKTIIRLHDISRKRERYIYRERAREKTERDRERHKKETTDDRLIG